MKAKKHTLLKALAATLILEGTICKMEKAKNTKDFDKALSDFFEVIELNKKTLVSDKFIQMCINNLEIWKARYENKEVSVQRFLLYLERNVCSMQYILAKEFEVFAVMRKEVIANLLANKCDCDFLDFEKTLQPL